MMPIIQLRQSSQLLDNLLPMALETWFCFICSIRQLRLTCPICHTSLSFRCVREGLFDKSSSGLDFGHDAKTIQILAQTDNLAILDTGDLGQGLISDG
jgi:hypothetical protein